MEFFQFNGVSFIRFVWCLCFFKQLPLCLCYPQRRPPSTWHYHYSQTFREAEDNEKDQETHPPPVRWICQNEVQFLKTQRHWQSGCIDDSKARSWCQTPVFGAPRMQTSDFWELPAPRVKDLKTPLLYSRSHRAEFAHVSSKNYSQQGTEQVSRPRDWPIPTPGCAV